MKLSDKILSLRKQRGLSQEELAEMLDVSRQAVSRWEVGSAMPDASNVLQLSRLFGVTTDYLLNDDYESDRDVPAVKSTEAAANSRIKKIAALCAALLGASGSAIIYILSRFIRVMIPYPVYDNGNIIFYMHSDEHTGYSYRYFVLEHNMVFPAILFWALFLASLIYLLLKSDTLRKEIRKFRETLRRKKQTAGTDAPEEK